MQLFIIETIKQYYTYLRANPGNREGAMNLFTSLRSRYNVSHAQSQEYINKVWGDPAYSAQKEEVKAVSRQYCFRDEIITKSKQIPCLYNQGPEAVYPSN